MHIAHLINGDQKIRQNNFILTLDDIIKTWLFVFLFSVIINLCQDILDPHLILQQILL